MPVITEEQENITHETNLVQLLNTGDPLLSRTNDEATIGTTIREEGRPYLTLCPLHPDSAHCTCPAFVDNWDLRETRDKTATDLDEPDYSKFENWIPKFFRPEKACDYCRSRRLDCYLQRGEPHCTPCASLFRECSLTQSNTLEATNYIEDPTGMFLDTLHAVDEDAAQEQGTFTGVKPLRSKIGNGGTSGPMRNDDAPGSTKRNGIRFPRHAVKMLRDWLDGHVDNPYPTEEEKAELERLTELKPIQIANWLANARRRKKVAQRSKPKSCLSPSLHPTTPAIAIPGAEDKPWEELNPFERWKNSPPENDPASITDIAHAVALSGLHSDGTSSSSPSSFSRGGKRSSNGSALSNLRAPSTASQETGQTSSLSASSLAISNNSSTSTHGSFGSFGSGLAGKRDRRRRRRPLPSATVRNGSEDKKRVFQCTFCTDTFKSKYDWTRHEKSLHLSLEKWICTPMGPVVTDPEHGRSQCAYCDLPNPSRDHVESHNHKQCDDKGLESRTFFRKDHLRQHLRLMHGCEMNKTMENWRSTAVRINSRCGFCAQRFSIWQERIDHLTAHFKAGARMSTWKGCRGLDPAVAAQVTNAMPPYLIGIEAVSPNPFSATNRAIWRESAAGPEGSRTGQKEGWGQPGSSDAMTSIYDAAGSKATCWEILTVRLGKYATRMASEGTVMTDEMLQAQARRIVYDSDDSWNQTAADNAEWLDLFKKAHGLDLIPSALGGQGLHVPEDLETYGDLGLRIPFAVQLQALNRDRSEAQADEASGVSDPHERTIEQRRKELQDIYARLSRGGVLHSDEQRCDHEDCKDNVIDFGSIDGASAIGYSPKRWCSRTVTPERADEMEEIVARAKTAVTVLETAVAAQQQEDENRRVRALRSLPGEISKSGSGRSGPNANAAIPGSTVLDGREKHGHQQAEYLAANARARSLAALARAEAPVRMHDEEASGAAGRPGILPRHRYELPDDRVTQFATATGAWQDSGRMGETFDTTAAPPTTSTGAMMEFLGANLGTTLPFSADAATSGIPVLQDAFATEMLDWRFANDDDSAAHDRAFMDELDELVRATTAADAQSIAAPAAAAAAAANVSLQEFYAAAMDESWTAHVSDAQLDTAMEDFNFDDITFDDVFDMPADESFGPIDGSL